MIVGEGAGRGGAERGLLLNGMAVRSLPPAKTAVGSIATSASTSASAASTSGKQDALAAGRRKLDEFRSKKASDKIKKTASSKPVNVSVPVPSLTHSQDLRHSSTEAEKSSALSSKSLPSNGNATRNAQNNDVADTSYSGAGVRATVVVKAHGSPFSKPDVWRGEAKTEVGGIASEVLEKEQNLFGVEAASGWMEDANQSSSLIEHLGQQSLAETPSDRVTIETKLPAASTSAQVYYDLDSVQRSQERESFSQITVPTLPPPSLVPPLSTDKESFARAKPISWESKLSSYTHGHPSLFSNKRSPPAMVDVQEKVMADQLPNGSTSTEDMNPIEEESGSYKLSSTIPQAGSSQASEDSRPISRAKISSETLKTELLADGLVSSSTHIKPWMSSLSSNSPMRARKENSKVAEIMGSKPNSSPESYTDAKKEGSLIEFASSKPFNSLVSSSRQESTLDKSEISKANSSMSWVSSSSSKNKEVSKDSKKETGRIAELSARSSVGTSPYLFGRKSDQLSIGDSSYSASTTAKLPPPSLSLHPPSPTLRGVTAEPAFPSIFNSAVESAYSSDPLPVIGSSYSSSFNSSFGSSNGSDSHFPSVMAPLSKSQGIQEIEDSGPVIRPEIKSFSTIHEYSLGPSRLDEVDRPHQLWPSPLSSRDEFAALEQHIEDLTQEKFAFQRGLDQARGLAESLAKENSLLTEDFNHQRALVDQLRAESESHRVQIRGHAMSVTTMKAERDKAQQENQAAIERSQAFAAEVITLEEKVRRLRSNELKLEKELKSVTSELELQKRQIYSLEKDRENLRSLVDALQEEQKVLQARIRKFSSGGSLDGSRPTVTQTFIEINKIDASTSTSDLEMEAGSSLGSFAPVSREPNSQMELQHLEKHHGQPFFLPTLPSMPLMSPSHSNQASASASLLYTDREVHPLPPSALYNSTGSRVFNRVTESSILPTDQIRTIDNINTLITEVRRFGVKPP